MPKVTSVEVQKQNTHRYNIFLDDVFAFGADEDLVVEYRLIPGKVLDPAKVEKLLFEAEVGKLMERMYRLFNIRQRSEKEVRDYFKNLSFKRKARGQDEISNVVTNLLIDKLKQKKLLSDADFAKSWVEVRRRSKKKGKLALKQELFQKGINKEIIEEVISGQVTGYSEEELAKQALEKKLRIWKNLPEIEFKKKAYGFLTRQGFEYEVIKNVIEKIIKKE